MYNKSQKNPFFDNTIIYVFNYHNIMYNDDI